MTPEDYKLLKNLYENPEPWGWKRSDDNKYIVGTFRLDIATADEKEAAELIVTMRNRLKDLIEENAKLKGYLGIRGPTFPNKGEPETPLVP